MTAPGVSRYDRPSACCAVSISAAHSRLARRVRRRPVDAADDVAGVGRAPSSPTSATRGDAAVRELTERFDGCALDDLRVPAAELAAALDAAAPELRAALELAARPDRRLPRGPARRAEPVLDRDGDRASASSSSRSTGPAATCPAAGAAYPSTVLMTAIPAQVAGVAEVVAVRPARPPTAPCPTPTLAAAALAGVDEVYRVGGAQAIAAMAYGTETIRAGRRDRRARQRATSRWRSARSRATVGDRLASPGRPRSWSSPTRPCPPAFVAADLLAQAEHGPGGVGRRSSPGTTPSPTRSTPRSSALLADAPRRAEIEADARARAAASCSSTDPSRRIDVGQRDRARAPRAHDRRPRRARAARAQRRRGVRAARTRRPSLGDYVAGREPRAAHRRHRAVRRARCGSTTSASTCTSSTLDRRRRSTAVAPHVDARWPSRRPRRARRRRSACAARSPCRRTLVTRRSQPRDDLRALEGYHSPQVDVAVRLNTNESPYAAAGRVRRPLARGSCATRRCNRYPDRGAPRAARRARRAPRPADRAAASAPTAATRCCRRCCSPTAAPAGARSMFEPTYALHAHIAAHHRHRGRRGRAAAPTSRSIPTPPSALIAASTRRRSCSCAAPTTPPARSSRATTVEALLAVAADGAPARGRRGLRRVRAVERARARRRRPPARRRAHLLEGVVDGGAAARLRGRRPRGSSPSSRRSCCRTTSSVPTQLAGTARARLRRRDGRRASPRWSRSAGGCSPRSPRSDGIDRVPVGRQLPALPRPTATATSVWQRAARPRRARARLLALAAARGLPPRHRRHARGERRVPRRAPRGRSRRSVR